MGRKKVNVESINDNRLRQVTFYKRKKGLIKKSMEIALLCGAKVMLCVVDKRGKSIVYTSDDTKPQDFIGEYITPHLDSGVYLTNKDVSMGYLICSMKMYISRRIRN
jgi:hypothetical protein